MAENDKVSRMAKLKAILNADAAIITILLAVGGGIIHVTNQIAVLQTTSDSHTAQIKDLHDAHDDDIKDRGQMKQQLDRIEDRLSISAPPDKSAKGWPTIPYSEQQPTATPKPTHSLFEPQFQNKASMKPPPQISGGRTHLWNQ